VRFSVVVFACIALCVAICGCSSSPADSDDANASHASSDSGTTGDAALASSDGGTSSDAAVVGVTPAFVPEMPHVLNDGGTILSAPQIVTVTWSTDTNASALNAFGDAIGTSDYWKPLAEYGIGAATSGAANHISIDDAPAGSMTEDQLDTFVSQHVQAAPGNGWPVNSAQTMYVIYTPESMKVTSSGKNDCESTDGYHDETSSASNAHIVYAVVLESCHDTTDVVTFSTETASHEMIESATDPHIQSDLAWTGFDHDHLAWDIWQDWQDEVADACEYIPDADYAETAPFAYTVQRFWSNASASAGHNPCLRVPSQSYFNVTPLDVAPITVTVDDVTGSTTTKGFEIPVGTTKTIRYGFYADGASDDWSVQFVEGDGFTSPTTPQLTITTDKTAGNNGDVANVSVTVNSAGATTGILMTAISTRGSDPIHYMPVLIGAY
jgi:hypothetical protein